MTDPPEIVVVSPDGYRRRYAPTYSIRQGASFWLTTNGRRRAWSTRYAAEVALHLETCPRFHPVSDTPEITTPVSPRYTDFNPEED